MTLNDLYGFMRELFFGSLFALKDDDTRERARYFPTAYGSWSAVLLFPVFDASLGENDTGRIQA